MLTKSKYPEHISKEAKMLLVSVSGGHISTPRLIPFLQEIAGETKPKKIDHRSILESKIK